MIKIYGLVCPIADEIRYVGQTKNSLGARLTCHLYDAKAGRYRHHTARWLRKFIAQQLEPKIVLLEEVKGDWVEREIYWISKAKN